MILDLKAGVFFKKLCSIEHKKFPWSMNIANNFPRSASFRMHGEGGVRCVILVPNCDLAMPITLPFGAFSFSKKKVPNNAVVCAPP